MNSSDLYNTKAFQLSYLQKVKALLEKRKDSGDENTRAHYRHLLYKIDKVLESDIAARDSR